MSDGFKKVMPSPEDVIARFGLNVVPDEEFDEKMRKEEELAKKERFDTWYKSLASGVPERYHKESLSTFHSDNKELDTALYKAWDFVRHKGGRIMLLCGKCGVGKSHLGCGIIRECGGIYITAMDLVYEVDSTMSFKAKETKIQLLDRICSYPLVVIDEVARMKVREDFQKELVGYIIDKMYSREKKLVLISNLEKLKLVEWLGKAVYDRLCECGTSIELFQSESYRMKKRSME